MLGEALTTAGVPTASLWSAVPTYTAQLTAAKATAVLVRATCAMVGAAVPTTALAAAVADYESRVADLLEDDKLAAYVRRLEEAMPVDDDADGAAAGLLGELDVDDDSRLVAEVEQFLRESGDEFDRRDARRPHRDRSAPMPRYIAVGGSGGGSPRCGGTRPACWPPPEIGCGEAAHRARPNGAKRSEAE